MVVSFPHCGNLSILLEVVLQELNIPYVTPPPNTKKTLTLGTRYSPETICLPCKLMLGNFIEAIELGADTLLTTRNRGICRLGYYYRLHNAALKNLGYDFRFEALESHTLKGVWDLVQRLKRVSLWEFVRAFWLGLRKLQEVENAEKLGYWARPRGGVDGRARGSGGSSRKNSVMDIGEGKDLQRRNCRHHERGRFRDEQTAGCDIPSANGIPKVRIVGEFYVVLEPFANMDLAVELGKMGVEAERSIYLADWTYQAFLPLLRSESIHDLAMPYLKRDVGGDGWESVGEKVSPAGDDVDGVIHVSPFGCLPEIVARNIMSTVEGRPVLSLVFDEQTSRTGVLTRVEAFVDLLRRRT